MEDLTLTDINILTDSLSLWEKKLPPEFIRKSVSIVQGTLEIANNNNMEESSARIDTVERDMREASRARMESSALLKAKLIGIKNRLVAEAL